LIYALKKFSDTNYNVINFIIDFFSHDLFMFKIIIFYRNLSAVEIKHII